MPYTIHSIILAWINMHMTLISSLADPSLSVHFDQRSFMEMYKDRFVHTVPADRVIAELEVSTSLIPIPVKQSKELFPVKRIFFSTNT